eukprot:7052494-Alexandrium_andersonii.AAC.1
MASSSQGPFLGSGGNGVIHLLVEFSRPVIGASPGKLLALAKAIEAGKAFLKGKVLRAIVDGGSLPLLVSYSADGTPIETSASHSAKLGQKVARRRAKGTEEHYIQQAFYVHRLPSGQWNSQ